jgi:hypothetical protein
MPDKKMSESWFGQKKNKNTMIVVFCYIAF